MGLHQQLRYSMLALAASSLGAGRYLLKLARLDAAQVSRPPSSLIEQLESSFARTVDLRADRVQTALMEAWEQMDSTDAVRSRRLVRAAPRTCAVRDPNRDVSIVVHLDVRKLKRLLLMARRWGDGPVSASIYLTSGDDIDELVSFLREHPRELCHTTFHVLFEKSTQEGALTSLGYPFNTLREMALRNSDTDFFLTMDVDLVTPVRGHAHLQSILDEHPSLRNETQHRRLLVLPAFNYERQLSDDEWLARAEELLPNTRDQAREQFRSGQLTPFKAKVHAKGHRPTDYRRWASDALVDASYPVRFQAGYEPYAVGYRDDGTPHYWTGFRGVGLDKISWTTESSCAGYRFRVLRDAFLVHVDHPYGSTRQSRATAGEFQKFRRYVERRYGCDVRRNRVTELPEIATPSARPRIPRGPARGHRKLRGVAKGRFLERFGEFASSGGGHVHARRLEQHRRRQRVLAKMTKRPRNIAG